MLDLLTYALICKDVYDPAAATAARDPALKGWGRVDYSNINFFASVYSGPEVVLAFRGTDGIGDGVEDLTAFGLGSGLWAFNDAIGLAQMFHGIYPKMTFTGHSLGGAYAQVAAAAASCVGVTFNAPGAFQLCCPMPSLGSFIPGNMFTNPVASASITAGRILHLSDIYNFRHPSDPVSLVGINIGRNQRTLPMPSAGVNVKRAHSIDTIAAWLTPGRAPPAFY